MKLVKSFNQREINTARSHPPSWSLLISSRDFDETFEFVNFDEDFYGKLSTVNSYGQWASLIPKVCQSIKKQGSRSQNCSSKQGQTWSIQITRRNLVLQRKYLGPRQLHRNYFGIKDDIFEIIIHAETSTTFSCSISDIYLFSCWMN